VAASASASIRRIAQGHPQAVIEAAVAAECLDAAGAVTRNRLLLAAIAHDPEAVGPVRRSLRALLPDMTVDDALRVLEQAIPPGDRDGNGAIYTPRRIADFIAARVITTGSETVLDPSCGAGAFLLAAVRRIAALTGRPVADIVAGQILGRDILPYSVEHARLLLALLAAVSGGDREEVPDRLSAGDALDPAWIASLHAAGGADAVIGNPPYIRFQELPGAVREHLSSGAWTTCGSGNFNLYAAFFELGLGALAPGGRLGYITPSAHFSTRSMAGLRSLLGPRLVEVVDCGRVRVFEEADAYTAVTIASASPSTSLVFRRPSRDDEQDDLDAVPAADMPTAPLGEAPWRLGYPDELAVLAAIEAVGHPLSEVAGLGVGLATLRDGLFLLSGATPVVDRLRIERGGAVFEIEAAVTRPVLKVSDHPDQASLDTASERVLFPYDDAGDTVAAIPEDRMRADYPGAMAYLDAVRPELAKRDHGAKTYDAWYAYGRRQGLRPAGRGQLLTPIYAASPRFLADPAPGRRFLNGYAVTPFADRPAGAPWSTPEGLLALRAVLESDAMSVYAQLTSSPLSGGYRCYAGGFTAPFGIPDPAPGDIARLAAAGRAEATAWYAERAGVAPGVIEAMADKLSVRRRTDR
jgi:SAM-dependent methyltransferase